MADQPSGGLNAPAVSGTAMATTPPVAQGTNAGVIPPDSAASKASSGSHDIVEADTVEKAMGDLLDQVQGQTNFPVSPPGTKLSSTLTYDVAAWLSVKVHGKWILFDGFELTDIGLKVALSKSTGSNGLWLQILMQPPLPLPRWVFGLATWTDIAMG